MRSYRKQGHPYRKNRNFQLVQVRSKLWKNADDASVNIGSQTSIQDAAGAFPHHENNFTGAPVGRDLPEKYG